ncbi:Cutinase [Akanthomyces lecanii RCEF 1005]|uniref:cutinase n=1 Tax=Akanthomyces lecanii RCEF 1005 TaxID=1081108 RepID=A0A162JMH1_CORDF|nr:Cutinase [Akanthomyces lecanii RCEF 1005]
MERKNRTPSAQCRTVLAVAASTHGSPLAGRQSNDVANDWDGLSCAELAVIFARGTFDSGNTGPWVGQPFREALYSKIGSDKLAFQGVDPQDYPANLDGYIEDGGPESCAPGDCTHHVGDPISVWSDSTNFPAPPINARLLSYCEANIPDPLCTNPLEGWPHSPQAFIDKLEAMWRDFSDADLNGVQETAIGDLIVQLTSQAKSKIGKLGKDILAGHIPHWMLTPQHFLYGLGPHPMTEQAAEDIARAFQQSK